ncbi:PadR family transcriptional regulator [Frigoribacterium sp. 2-23]|uniref:PadR family transcriptional regulator n=1 Tax=Frigoribacterium sp. 2-23 TaxID=3415006 RepID=UPI003C70042B
MVLDILLLAVLQQGPVHGYELKRRVRRPSLTPVSNNSLYPSLRRFEAGGAVTVTLEKLEGRPQRRVYAITPDGSRLLHDLLTTFPVDRAADDDQFYVRLASFDALSTDERDAILAARLEALDLKVEHVRHLQRERETQPTGPFTGVALEHYEHMLRRERDFALSLRALG